MSEQPGDNRFYGELASWWPLISPTDEYAEEAAFIGSVLASAGRPVSEALELGSGGGHNALYLKERFSMTLVDLSADMLEVSRRLNPDCEHHLGDMRTIRLGRAFDAVLIHDAVDYMTNEDDLREALQTAFVHCRPGGVAVFVPDDIAETFVESSDHGGVNEAQLNQDAQQDQDARPAHIIHQTEPERAQESQPKQHARPRAGTSGRAARFLEWSWDPDPTDTWVLTEYAFLLRDADGTVRLVHETHRNGLFDRSVWLRLLAEVGFEASALDEETTEDRHPRVLFVGHRPS